MTERITKWLISVRSGNRRRDFEFSTYPGEKPTDTYRRVKSNAQKLDKQLKGKAKIEIISLTLAFKPKGMKPYPHWYWCPYCNQWRVFNYDDYLGVERCSICGVTNQEYFVKKYNS